MDTEQSPEKLPAPVVEEAGKLAVNGHEAEKLVMKGKGMDASPPTLTFLSQTAAQVELDDMSEQEKLPNVLTEQAELAGLPKTIPDPFKASNSTEPENMQLERQPVMENHPEPLRKPMSADAPEPEPEKLVESIPEAAGLSEQTLREPVTLLQPTGVEQPGKPEEVPKQAEKIVAKVMDTLPAEIIKEVMVEQHVSAEATSEELEFKKEQERKEAELEKEHDRKEAELEKEHDRKEAELKEEEERKMEELKKEEERKMEELKKEEERKMAELKKEEERKLEELKAAELKKEEERKAAELKKEEERKAVELKKEQEMKEAELKKEEERKAAELKKEQEMKEAELKKEQEMKEAELKKEEERKAAELKKEEERKAAELKKEEERKAAELKKEEERKASELKKEEERKAAELKKEQEMKEAELKKEEERKAAEFKEQEMKEAEVKKEEERKAAELKKEQDLKEAELKKGEEVKEADLKQTEEKKEAEMVEQKEAVLKETEEPTGTELKETEEQNEAELGVEKEPTPGSLSFPLLDQEQTKVSLQASRTLVVLRGLPGSGKSRVARAIADNFQDLCSVFCADDHGIKPENPEASTDGYKALDEAVVAHCSTQKNAPMVVVVDDTNHTLDRLARLGEIAEQQRLVAVFLEPRTEWSRDLSQLPKKTGRDLKEAQFEVMNGPFADTILPLYFGWFLMPTTQDKVKCTSMDFLKTLDTLDAFKKHSADFNVEAEKEVDLEQYFQSKGILHCTTKFCDYGKAEGAKEYAEKTAVKELYGSAFELSLSALFVTPHTVGARVSLSEEQLVLWPADAEKEAQSEVPAAASLPLGSRAHVTLGCANGVEPVQTGFDLLEILALQQDGQQGELVEEMELGSLAYYGNGRWLLSLREPISVQAFFSSLYHPKKADQTKTEKKKKKCTIL